MRSKKVFNEFIFITQFATERLKNIKNWTFFCTSRNGRFENSHLLHGRLSPSTLLTFLN